MIKVSEPSTTSNEINWVNKALRENKISAATDIVEKFENEFAKKIGTKYAVAVNSGTSALFLALWALGIRKGDEVIVPDFTMISTANAVKQCGATPVFVDARLDTCNIDETLIEDKITPKTKAIIPVHIYGHPCEMEKIGIIANKYNLYVIEDAAEAHGAEYKGKIAGSMGDVGCFSFYANKIITTGEGGMVVTNDKKIADEVSLLRACYFYPEYHFWHRKVAWNMRFTSLQAAYGLGQLERWNELIQARIDHAKYYTAGLRDIVDTPIELEDCKNVYWMYGIMVENKEKRNKLMEYLKGNGVETRTYFHPCHLQPPYKENKEYPISERLGVRGLYLPSSFNLTKKEQDKIINLIGQFYEK